MYETHRHRPIPARLFVRRVLWHFAGASGVVAASLGMGMVGDAYYEHLAWRDAYLNAAMLLGGMGPVEMPETPGGKLFAGTFALYSGLIFLVAIGIVLAPTVHRVLHTFHWESDGTK